MHPSSCNLSSDEDNGLIKETWQNMEEPSTSEKQYLRSVAFRSYSTTPVPYEISLQDTPRLTPAEITPKTKFEFPQVDNLTISEVRDLLSDKD